MKSAHHSSDCACGQHFNRRTFMRDLAATGLLLGAAPAALASAAGGGHGEGDPVRGMIHNLLQDNAAFAKGHNTKYFQPFKDGQHPRATLVTCSDSRVHLHALDKTPDNDIFVIRNIGNQLATAEGSVEYGVHHLHTPLLVFLGHSACGAIKAASGDYSAESSPIKRELDTIRIPKNGDMKTSILLNVNNQVSDALKKFPEEVKEGKLTVVGAIYDFRNDFGQGVGKLIIVNINGETSSEAIRERLKTGSIAGNPMMAQGVAASQQMASASVKPVAGAMPYVELPASGNYAPRPVSFP